MIPLGNIFVLLYLKMYKEKDIYLADNLSPAMSNEWVIPSFLLCGGYTQRLAYMYIWLHWLLPGVLISCVNSRSASGQFPNITICFQYSVRCFRLPFFFPEIRKIIYKSSHSAIPGQSGMECQTGISLNKHLGSILFKLSCFRFFVTYTLTSIASDIDWKTSRNPE